MDVSSVTSAANSLLLLVLAGWSLMAPLSVIPACRIFRRAGIRPWLSVITMLPVAGLLVGALILAWTLRSDGAVSARPGRAIG